MERFQKTLDDEILPYHVRIQTPVCSPESTCHKCGFGVCRCGFRKLNSWIPREYVNRYW